MGTAATTRRGGLDENRVWGRRRGEWRVGGGRPGRDGADPVASASIGGGVWLYGRRRIGVGWGGDVGCEPFGGDTGLFRRWRAETRRQVTIDPSAAYSSFCSRGL
jgi:hypothetical protein